MIEFLAAELPPLWSETESAVRVRETIERVQATVAGRAPRQKVLRGAQELGWVGVAILIGLVIAWISGLISPHMILPMSGTPADELPLVDLPSPTPGLQLFPGALEEVTLFETDLDCDGTIERMIGTRPRETPGFFLYNSMLLETLALEASVDGETRKVLEVESLGSALPALLQPQLILPSEESCEQLIAVPSTSGSNIYGSLKIYRWNGETVETVLDAPGWPALDPTPPGRIMTVQRFASLDPDKQCTWTLTTYEWSGSRFEQASQREQPVTCENYARTQPTGEIFQATGEIGGRFTQILAQTDLNCDGRFERLLLERGTQSIYEYVSPRVYRLMLEDQGKIVWELSPSEEGGYLFGPELFSVGGCEKLLAMAHHTNLLEFGVLQIYRWDGQTMTLLLETPGLPPTPKSLLRGLVQQPDQPFTITTVAVGIVEIEPGWCENTVYSYQWDGATFQQTKKEPVRVKCGG